MKAPYTTEFRAQVIESLRANPWSVQAVAKAYGVAVETVLRWARGDGVELPDSRERMVVGGLEGTARQWGDAETRRRRARLMRLKGASYQEIAKAVGYRSLGSVHNALAKRS